MYEKQLEKRIDVIMREGVPLFQVEQIKKMLRRMHDETLKTLKIDIDKYNFKMAVAIEEGSKNGKSKKK